MSSICIRGSSHKFLLTLPCSVAAPRSSHDLLPKPSRSQSSCFAQGWQFNLPLFLKGCCSPSYTSPARMRRSCLVRKWVPLDLRCITPLLRHGSCRIQNCISSFSPYFYYTRPASIFKYFSINSDVWNTKAASACCFRMGWSINQGLSSVGFSMQIKFSMLA